MILSLKYSRDRRPECAPGRRLNSAQLRGCACLLISVAACTDIASATVAMHTSESTWTDALQGLAESPFTLSASALSLADEVSAPPAEEEDLGTQVLTFPATSTGLPCGFVMTSVHADNTWIYKFSSTFADREHLSPGDDGGSADDWSVSFTDGAPVFGFALLLLDNDVITDELFTIQTASGGIVTFTPPSPPGSSPVQFVGFTSEEPLASISFISDTGGDDHFLADLRFAAGSPMSGLTPVFVDSWIDGDWYDWSVSSAYSETLVGPDVVTGGEDNVLRGVGQGYQPPDDPGLRCGISHVLSLQDAQRVRVEYRARSGVQWPNNVIATLTNSDGERSMFRLMGESTHYSAQTLNLGWWSVGEENDHWLDPPVYIGDAAEEFHTYAWERDDVGWWFIYMDNVLVRRISPGHGVITNFDAIEVRPLRNQTEIDWVRVSIDVQSGPCTLQEGVELLAYDAEAEDVFGHGTAVDDGVLVIGAPGDDDLGAMAGAAYVYAWDGTDWVLQVKLTASDGAEGDVFGSDVTIDGGVIVVSAPKNDAAGGDAGAAYVFHWNGAEWFEQDKLTATDGEGGDEFGTSVHVDGNSIIVGAFYDDDNGSNAGAAYVFHWTGAEWIEEAKLLASDGAASDRFGTTVDISGDVAIVGSPRSDPNGSCSGSAYVFRWNGSVWIEDTKLLANDTDEGDYFGTSVSLSGDTALIGAYQVDDNGERAGAAYVFRWNGATWIEEAKLLPSDGDEFDEFGEVVSIHGDVAVIGTTQDDDLGSNSGSAYVYRWNGSAWIESAKLLAPGGVADDRFGQVSVGGSFILAAAPASGTAAYRAGAAYVLPSAWSRSAMTSSGCSPPTHNRTMFGGMWASLRPSSPCCWCVEIAGMVATLLMRPRSVARQMRCKPSKNECGRSRGRP
jgi:hypothetical protein